MRSPAERNEARLQLYCLIAGGFSHPEADSMVVTANEEFRNQVASSSEILFGKGVQINPLATSFDEFEAEYIELFLLGNGGKPAVYLHAGDYDELTDGQPRPEFLLHYSNWYRHFGLKTRQDDEANELSDYLVCQFEFLAWLSNLQAKSGDNAELESGYIAAQRDFIERQVQPFLACMLPRLQRETKKRATTRFFLELGELARTTLDRTVHEFNSIVNPSTPKETLMSEPEVSKGRQPVDLWG